MKIVPPEIPTNYDDKLALSGRICTSDPSDLVFPLKVLFVIDTSQSMEVSDPLRDDVSDPLERTGRCKAVRDVIGKFIDIHMTFPNTYCNTGEPNCDKGNTQCGDCSTVAPQAMCIGPDCCKAAPCHGVTSCPPLPDGVNGTCVPLCDTTKLGCQPGEKDCKDCPNPGDQCHGGVCAKNLDPGVEFAIMRFGSAKQVLTKNKDGVEGFTSDVRELVTALPQVNNHGSVTDYEGALGMAFHTLSRDMADMQKRNAAAVARSKYVVVFLSDGAPYPKISDQDDWGKYDNPDIPGDDELVKDLIGDTKLEGTISQYNIDSSILRRVKEIMGLRTVYHVGDIRFHTAYLAEPNTPSSVEDQATYLLKQMAKVGQGTFRSFPNGEEINFLHVDFSSLRRVFRVKNFLVSNMNAQPSGAGMVTDSDGDGVNDIKEKEGGTGPATADTDGDGFSDTLEHFFRSSGWDSLNPADADCSLKANDLDGDGIPDDSDGDGLADCEERFLGTSKDLIDTDADGIPDGIEVRFGTNPVVVDVEDDLDFDGMPNGDEIRLHTDPRADDAAHRSRLSYRYDVHQTGTGIETVGLRCDSTAPCPASGDCQEGYCRCVSDDACSSKKECKADADCTTRGETCATGKCTGTWSCSAALPGLANTSNVCSAVKHITCYRYEVANITLVTPRAPTVSEEKGWNQIQLVFGEVPFDNPMDYGNFKMACVRASYQQDNGEKRPLTGRVEIPEIAWHDPREFGGTYVATSPDSSGGKISCGSAYCNAGDTCVHPEAKLCRRVGCVCPDGNVGTCPLPTAP
jgi:hypothetical protein